MQATSRSYDDVIEWRRTRDGVYDVLDHGYLKVIRAWGSDQEIIESARMSTDKGFLGWDPGPCPACAGSGRPPVTRAEAESGRLDSTLSCDVCAGKGRIPGDAKLLRYLYEHKHSTPFEFAGITIELQAPIMAFREWHRHRTQGYSEMSARYVQMPNIHYVPSVRRIIDSSRKSGNRQVSGGGAIYIPGSFSQTEEAMAAEIQHLIRGEQQRIYTLYEQLLSFGVSKEIARLDTPVSRYSRMRATANLRNWLGFLTLRMDMTAQFEIRQFAWAVADVIEREFPRTWALHLETMAPKKSFDPKQMEELIAAHQQLKNALSSFDGQHGFPEHVAELQSIEGRIAKFLGAPAT
jgi:thymidylate synthase (FAD)